MDKARIEQIKQSANIWGMIAAGGFIAACFQCQFIWGLILGVYSVHMSLKLTRQWAEAEEGNEHEQRH